jgi:hypothetical protein
MAFSLSSEAAGLNPTYTVGTPDSDGVVTGVVTATQILDYPLVFTGSTELPTGLAIVNGDGTFTYTPYPGRVWPPRPPTPRRPVPISSRSQSPSTI